MVSMFFCNLICSVELVLALTTAEYMFNLLFTEKRSQEVQHELKYHQGHVIDNCPSIVLPKLSKTLLNLPLGFDLSSNSLEDNTKRISRNCIFSYPCKAEFTHAVSKLYESSLGSALQFIASFDVFFG